MSCDYNKPCSECTCGTRTNAVCIDVEMDVPECSELTLRKNTLEAVIEDIYSISCSLKSEVDVSNITGNCLSDFSNLQELLQALSTKVCELNGSINTIPDFNTCNINYSGLVQPCETFTAPTTQCGFNQLVIDQITSIWQTIQGS